MSYKTTRLASLFPDAYAAGDTASLLYTLLDAVGAELMMADEAVKRLLKSHWVRYAEALALDGLAASFGVERRITSNGQPETDDAFRQRLMSVVPQFTGGGTVNAVKGAVRSALGLPFNLDQLGIPENFADLRRDIEALVQLDEFSPEIVQTLGTASDVVNDALQLVLTVSLAAVRDSIPRIIWKFPVSSGRLLSLRRIDTNTGIRSLETFLVPAGKTLILEADTTGRLSALLDGAVVTSSFVNLDGSVPAILPAVPPEPSEWEFRAHGASFERSGFDAGEAFDVPSTFLIELSRVRLQPLTFDVQAPYFLKEAVDALRVRYGYPADILVFQGLPLDKIQEVVDQTKAAGVRGSIHFSLNFFETHNVREELFRRQGLRRAQETQNQSEKLLVANVNEQTEKQDLNETFRLGAVFDIATFDGSFGLQ